ncbi:(2Fe-2S) ferredoxin domain-containing protein [Dermatophilus congolensis]|uniref:(2Fe-2S) ferredoxin domain-containing protein n=1 Tax=Dermatophilus congolensis TaxID=1863 RepID=UPI001AAF25D4|nr:(2Fe-2S) ferredoxin domain-containing protein [Dermatophilus congolensis]MBO3130640.1 (2Fe-2S) ferredoxin domain-containing protein [Dermatophilus congolensis]MBO3130730.1 (2Fe-2S) ferredoxin domain-containing protein [Dermatophilus congolensis]MBO3135113.1 (2Fe-2S) ferredoxin domain-containing protein [Dermatophilus congolensis]MBO3137352.1 (2Fe-2S) ferredoxin domain-containing protein [Dermatophilus congolensis]MBO3139593.1 (2Fe-2S) ferredoxin domain-containing protein [Dermatophilus cong
MTTLVLVTIDLTDPHPQDTINQAATCLHAQVAALQGNNHPSLTHTLDTLEAQNTQHVLLIPVTCDNAATGPSWVRRVAGHWKRTRNSSMDIDVITKPVHDPTTYNPDEQPRRAVTGHEAPLHNPTWEQPPPHTHHVLLCRGPRCNAQGADAIATRIRDELRHRDLLDNGVLLTQTGCLYPCNRAPVIVIHPDGTWHGPVDEDDIPVLVDQNLTEATQPPQ